MEGILEQCLTPIRLFLRDAVSKILSMSAQADPLKLGLAVVILSTVVYCLCPSSSSRSNKASIHLEDLSTQNLCKLFDYCHLSCLNSIIREQEISGAFLSRGFKSQQHVLKGLGCKPYQAAALISFIQEWIDEGLPEGFLETLPGRVQVPSIDLRATPPAAVTYPVAANVQPNAAVPSAPSGYTGKLADHPLREKHQADFVLAERKNDKEAQGRIQEAADTGDHLAQAYMSLILHKIYRFEEDKKEGQAMSEKCLPWLRREFSSGDATAQYLLGRFTAEGLGGIACDAKEAFRLYQQSADQGYAEARYTVGICYRYGKGVKRSRKEAFTHCKQAADKGHSEAQYEVGRCYDNGKITGIETVIEQANNRFKYYKLAADQGHSAAQTEVGSAYKTGRGTKIDDKISFEYYKMAADQGDWEGRRQVAKCYEFGRGVAEDSAEADKYSERIN